MNSCENLKIDSKCVHAGIGEYEHGAVVPPIYQTSTFKFESADHGGDLFSGKQKGYIYSRMLNPTVQAMEDAVAILEGGHKGLGCGSGMAAINTVLTALLSAGDHIVCSKSVYGPTNTLISTVLSKFNIDATFINSSNLSELESAIKSNTKVIYIETPGNPTLEMTDLRKVSEIADKNGLKVVVDNTFMSPILLRPLEFGVDVVLHSMTKFLNGHADVVAGIIVVKDEDTYLSFRKILNQLGGVIDPFNAFLVHRGLKTLAIRMKKHCENSILIAEFLENNDKVEWVKYPGLKSFPDYELAQSQHDGPGGMISFEVKGGIDSGKILMNSVKLCQLAVSLGGVETLIQHPASMTHLTMGKEARESAGITDGLIRLSVGIEDVEDIIGDLKQALNKI
jgi:methionine-gamma-lyase